MEHGAEIIVGQVMHERLRPVRNRFVYPVFCLRLDLAQLGSLRNCWFAVDRWAPLSLRTRDYGPRDGSSLLDWMRGVLWDAGINATGPVHLQTFPRVLGYAFNPVSFWYCHGADGSLRAVLAEVNNTFGEHHRYLLAAPGNAPITPQTVLECRKLLHVSPFCAVEGGYQFRFRDVGDMGDMAGTRFVGIDYRDAQGLLIRTAIGGRSLAFSPAHLRRTLLRQPLLTLGVVARIHWQALRLWWRGVPLHHKPAPPLASTSQPPTPQENHP